MKTLRKAFDILNFLAQEERDVRLTEIADKLDINKTSVHKMLAVMCDYEYVRQDSDSTKYGLGGKFVEMGSKMIRSINIRAEASPYMRELMRETEETVNLMVRHGNKGLYAEIFESPHVNRVFQTVGTVEYLHACAIGKVLLSYMPPSEVDRIVAAVGLPARTKYTITDYDELKGQLKEIKKQGFGLDSEEVCLGVFCVAAPVFDHLGNAIAAMSISAPTVRMSDELIAKYVVLVKETSEKISHAMHYKN